MGCCASTTSHVKGIRRRHKSIGELAFFVPGFRIPIDIDFSQPLGDNLPKGLVNRLSALRTRIVAMGAHEATNAIKKSKQKTITRNGTSTFSDLLQALEDYLPVLLGLAKDGSQLRDKVQFVWLNQEDDDEQTAIADVWYEVLSVLHLMAMICLAEANYLLLPRRSNDGHQQRVSEENRRRSIDVLLKAAGYLDCSIRHVLPQIPLELRKLPVDLSEGVLHALCMQALGQGVDIQLGMAIDSPKATLAVKRRLACEMVKYWHQAHDSIVLRVRFSGGLGEKHQLFVKWKYAEAKAAAYYYHGLILDQGSTEKSHSMAVAALQASEEYLKESKRACEVFNLAPPTSRSPPPWGSAKYLSEKLLKEASIKAHTNQDLYSHERVIQAAPALPDFALALKPDDYHLPPLDPIWNTEDLN